MARHAGATFARKNTTTARGVEAIRCSTVVDAINADILGAFCRSVRAVVLDH